MTTTDAARADNNSLGKGAFIIGLLALILAFIPFIGFVSWILGPLAIICGGIAVMRPRRSLAIAGIVTGVLALAICFWWAGMASEVGKAISSDAFNTTGAATDLSDAPIVEATIKGVWDEMEANKVAAGQKYGGKRLRFTDQAIADFSGDAANPVMLFEGGGDQYLTYNVAAAFGTTDGARIADLAKGQRVTFVCEIVREAFGGGYSLAGCTLS